MLYKLFFIYFNVGFIIRCFAVYMSVKADQEIPSESFEVSLICGEVGLHELDGVTFA